MADCLALREDLGQVLRAQHVAQRRRSQQVRRVAAREREEEDTVRLADFRELRLQ